MTQELRRQFAEVINQVVDAVLGTRKAKSPLEYADQLLALLPKDERLKLVGKNPYISATTSDSPGLADAKGRFVQRAADQLIVNAQAAEIARLKQDVIEFIEEHQLPNSPTCWPFPGLACFSNEQWQAFKKERLGLK